MFPFRGPGYMNQPFGRGNGTNFQLERSRFQNMAGNLVSYLIPMSSGGFTVQQQALLRSQLSLIGTRPPNPVAARLPGAFTARQPNSILPSNSVPARLANSVPTRLPNSVPARVPSPFHQDHHMRGYGTDQSGQK